MWDKKKITEDEVADLHVVSRSRRRELFLY
jgi:hypothetical protein